MASISSKLNQIEGKRQVLLSQLYDTEQKIDTLSAELEISNEALVVVNAAAKATQQQLQQQLGDIVTESLRAVFPDPYEFRMEFVHRRGNTELDLLFYRGNNSTRPLKDSGFGAADIASFALHLSFLMMSGKARLLIIDEPFRQLSEEYREAAVDLVYSISKKLNIQIVLVTHINQFSPDYTVMMKGGVSNCLL